RLRRDLDLRLDHRLLTTLGRHTLVVRARLLHVLLASRPLTAAAAARGVGPLLRGGACAGRRAAPATALAWAATAAAARAAPALAHRTEALAVGPAPAGALAGGAEALGGAAAAAPRVLVAEALVARGHA